MKISLLSLFIMFFLMQLNPQLVQGQSLKLTSSGSAINARDLDISGNQITVEATILMTDLNSINIVSKHFDTTDVNYLLRPTIFCINTTTGWKLLLSNYRYEINKWYHVAGIYDGTTIKYYVNGCLINQMSATGNLILNNHPTTIGYSIARATQPISEQFYGNIDEVRIWNVARTQAQIQANAINLPNPTTQTGLKLYYKFSNNYTNLQGNAAFNGTAVGTPTFNASEMTALPATRPITEGLVAYYPFNGNAQDASGNGNNGTVNGATLTADRFGRANSAYLFGRNRHIEVPHSNSVALKDKLSISAWVNVNNFLQEDSRANFSGILQKTGNQSHGGGDYQCGLGENFMGLSTSISNNPNQGISATVSVQIGRWYHLVITWDGDLYKLYVDNVLKATSAVTGIIDNSQKSLFIGANPDGEIEWFTGKLDDIRIYNRALTECEVKDLYDSEKPPVPACASSLDNGLVAYYPFNGNAQDASGNGNNGTVNGSTLATDRFGVANKAYSFDGANDFITIPSSPSLKIDRQITLSAWVKTKRPYNGAIFQKGRAREIWDYGLNSYYSYTSYRSSEHDWIIREFDNRNDKYDEWHLFTVTVDESVASNRLKYYLDGQLLSGTFVSFPRNGTESDWIRQSDFPLIIGKGLLLENDYPYNEYFNGVVDDIRIYNRALTECEVKDLYDSEKPDSDLCASFGFETSVDSTVFTPNSIETCNNQLYYVYPIGGKTPYQYKWSNGSTEQFIGGVAAGDYRVTVTDANNCSIDTTITVTLTELPVIAVNSKTSANCTAGGAVQIAVTKGVEPYAYRWSNGQTTTNLSNLAAGTYTLTVSDANGCTDTETVVISLQVVTPSISNIQTNQATVNWSSVAGVSSYEVQYRKKGDTNWIVAGSSVGNSLAINNLQPQTDYEVQVIAKCSGTLSSTSVIVAFKTIGAATCNAPSLPIVQNLQTTSATVTWAAVANAVEYRVELKKEADTNFRFFNATSSNSMVLSNLEANTRYQVRVKTVCNGLESQASAVATFATLSNNSTPNIPTDGLQLWLRGDAGVVLTNNLVGEWKDQSGNNRHAVQSAADARPTLQNNALNGKPVVRFQAAGNGDGLSVAGMDLSNTSKVEIFVVYNNTNDPAFGGVTVLENTPNFNINPTGFGIFDNDDSCFNCKNGVNVGHRGNVGFHILNTPPLEAGYRMLNTMLDKSSTQEVALKINGEAPSDATFVFGSNNTNSFGNNTTYIGKRGAGNIENSAPMEGGVAEILVYNNLLNTADRTKVENYLCQKYNLPCKTDVCAGFQFKRDSFFINSIQTCGNELYYVYPEGGLLPYSYQWSNGSQENFIAGVPSGDYQVTVTDAAGCTIETTINVPVIEYPEVTVISTTSGTCSNGGAVQISVVKGLAPYAYRWSNGQTTANLTDLGAGTYTVTVSDAKGCTATATATINLRTAVMESILSRSSQATFNWTGVAGATRYELQYRVRNTANWQAGGTVTTNSVTVTNLIPNTDYEARIITTCASGRSSTSSPVRFSTLPSGTSGLQQVNFKDGVATAADINQFTLFPNPTSGNLTIQYQSSEATAWAWTISDATGRVIQKVQSPYASGNVTLDVSSLPSGLYWVSTVMNGQVLVEKVVKK